MPQPNLLFIYTDEQAAGTMAAYGNDLIETPNMDRLAGEGVVFERAYVTQPGGHPTHQCERCDHVWECPPPYPDRQDA